MTPVTMDIRKRRHWEIHLRECGVCRGTREDTIIGDSRRLEDLRSIIDAEVEHQALHLICVLS
jgi:hypothetical protein